MTPVPNQPPPVRETIDDIVGTSRTLLLKRIDLLQLEAEHLLDDAATRLSEASAALVLGSLALLTGTVGIVAWGAPTYGLAGSCGMVAGTYGLLALCLAQLAKGRRNKRRRQEQR